MAYLDQDTLFSGPLPQVLREAPAAVAKEESFSALEWNVVALARRDTLRTLSAPGPITRAMGSLFGLGTQSRLADPRLEALRRVAVFAWRRGFAIPAAEVTRFLEAGFTERQLERLVESITGWRVQPRTARAA